MSWKSQISRNLNVLRFFACPESPSSRGLYKWFTDNYEELKLLNPTMQLLFRDAPNCMPAVCTEIDFTIDDLLRYMIQTNKFKDLDGTINQRRVEAAKAYLRTDWDTLRNERWLSPGFDPEKPYLEETNPNWRDDPVIARDLSNYIKLKDQIKEQTRIYTSGPNEEYRRAENALLMCQRVDLWCAGPKEVDAAVLHLVKLGERFNDYEPDYPQYIREFYPGQPDL